MNDEVWRPVPDWEGFYSVSDRGRVRSEPRYVYRPTIARGYRVAGRVLNPTPEAASTCPVPVRGAVSRAIASRLTSLEAR